MWVFSSKQCGREGVHFYIGQVKVAEIVMSKTATKWKYFLRLMRNDVSYEIKSHYETFSAALTDLHKLLNSPPQDTET